MITTRESKLMLALLDTPTFNKNKYHSMKEIILSALKQEKDLQVQFSEVEISSLANKISSWTEGDLLSCYHLIEGCLGFKVECEEWFNAYIEPAKWQIKVNDFIVFKIKNENEKDEYYIGTISEIYQNGQMYVRYINNNYNYSVVILRTEHLRFLSSFNDKIEEVYWQFEEKKFYKQWLNEIVLEN